LTFETSHVDVNLLVVGLLVAAVVVVLFGLTKLFRK
jgi:hypothetical protein